MAEKVKLLPCPFCGGEASVGKRTFVESQVRSDEMPQATFYFVNCMICTAQTDTMRGSLTEAIAAARWNTRKP